MLYALTVLAVLECVAQGEMKKEGWAYYVSAADDEITLRVIYLSIYRYQLHAYHH